MEPKGCASSRIRRRRRPSRIALTFWLVAARQISVGGGCGFVPPSLPTCRRQQRPLLRAGARQKHGSSSIDKRKGSVESAKLVTKNRAQSTPERGQKVPQPSVRTQLDFARNGHCVLRGALSPHRVANLQKDLSRYAHQQELVAWQQKVQVAAQSSKRANACRTVAECRQALVELGASSADEIPFLQYFNTWRSLPSVLEVAKELAVTASILLDCESVRLYQDSYFWKRAGDGPTPWHTDGRMAPFDTSLLVTFWIPLHDISRHGSALVFCSKSHSDFALPYWNEYSKTHQSPDSPWNQLDARYGGDKALVDYMPLAMGDVTAHSGWTLHCADPVAPGDEDRFALAISLVDSQAPVRKSVRGGTDEIMSREESDAGDPEDAWSYRDWIHEVPANRPNFQHKLVPILYRKTKSRS